MARSPVAVARELYCLTDLASVFLWCNHIGVWISICYSLSRASNRPVNSPPQNVNLTTLTCASVPFAIRSLSSTFWEWWQKSPVLWPWVPHVITAGMGWVMLSYAWARRFKLWRSSLLAFSLMPQSLPLWAKGGTLYHASEKLSITGSQAGFSCVLGRYTKVVCSDGTHMEEVIPNYVPYPTVGEVQWEDISQKTNWIPQISGISQSLAEPWTPSLAVCVKYLPIKRWICKTCRMTKNSFFNVLFNV